MTLLYPQLPPRRARALVEALAIAPCRQLEEVQGDQVGTIRSATGGTSATPNHLECLRKAIRRVGEAHGYIYGSESGPAPLQSKQRGSFDASLARCMAQNLQVSASEASRPGLWCYLGCLVAPELVRWRFWGADRTTTERFLGKRLRNMFGRVWWRARLLKDTHDKDPWWLLDQLGEDELVQITERPNAAGYRPLAVALGRCLVRMWDPAMPINRPELLRDVMKRILRLLPLAAMELVDDEEVQSEVETLFRESLRSLGVVVREQTEEVEVARFDPALPWRAVSRERRFALVEALSDEQLERLGPLVNRTLPDHKEYQLRWRVHHQLDATLGQVVDLVGPSLPDRLGGGQLGPWLAEEPAGTWATSTDAGRAAQLIDSLTQTNLQELYSRIGWPWSAGLTWSDAQRQLRRRYNGDWRELLLALQMPDLKRIGARARIDAAAPHGDLLRSVARWLTVNPSLAWPGSEAIPAASTTPAAPAHSVDWPRSEAIPAVPPSIPATAAPSVALPSSEATPAVPSLTPAAPAPQPRAAAASAASRAASLPPPPSLIQNTLTRAGVRTVAELLALDVGTLRNMPGVGRRKLETVANFQAEVAASMTGGQDLPSEVTETSEIPSFSSVEDLDRWLFEVLEGRMATVFALRFDGATLSAIGEALGVGRERARQLYNAAIAELHQKVGAVAENLLCVRAGTASLGQMLWIDEPSVHLAALASVASGESWVQVQPGLAWRGSRGSLSALCHRLNIEIGERWDLSMTELEQVARTQNLSSEQATTVLTQLEGWLQEGTGLHLPAGREDGVRRRLVQQLRDSGGPVHQNEIAHWLMQMEGVEEWPEEERTFIRRAETMMDRDPEVLRCDRGTFVHEDRLPAPRAQLEGVVDHCLGWITGVSGPVEVADVLARLTTEGLDTSVLNVHLLKSLLVARPEVRALRKGLVERVHALRGAADARAASSAGLDNLQRQNQ